MAKVGKTPTGSCLPQITRTGIVKLATLFLTSYFLRMSFLVVSGNKTLTLRIVWTYHFGLNTLFHNKVLCHLLGGFSKKYNMSSPNAITFVLISSFDPSFRHLPASAFSVFCYYRTYLKFRQCNRNQTKRSNFTYF